MLKDIQYGDIELSPVDIERFKRKVFKKMSKQLRIDKAMGDTDKASKFSLVKVDTKYIQLFHKDASIGQLLEDAETLKVLTSKRNFRHVGVTQAVGRTDYYKCMEARYDVFTFLEEPAEDNVIALTMKFVSKCIYKSKWDKWQMPECSVMALFKEGKISWKDVLERHNQPCSI